MEALAQDSFGRFCNALLVCDSVCADRPETLPSSRRLLCTLLLAYEDSRAQAAPLAVRENEGQTGLVRHPGCLQLAAWQASTLQQSRRHRSLTAALHAALAADSLPAARRAAAAPLAASRAATVAPRVRIGDENKVSPGEQCVVQTLRAAR
ncbi:uncharacterized protein BDZ99DRAFT_481888 [Mytilinidion resinicola]|uniref:Uncharacterized protein n=1 Tax=Mytilinidion resinicola TaxID=574789 RepID=A0A6A6Y620_9PEZI|nr:uncharacterized protein BDZ99DRAFT_481888 [Mytilinidion resinicola]KAF2803454.1 hypothetical protein BDZ99DRAFT_481888 [Mytilinidion resinicola]